MSRTRGPGVAHEQRRGELVAAVLAITAAKGVAAATLSAVAGRAGVSPGRVQHYFPTREDMLSAAFEQVNAERSARIAAALGGDPETAPAREVLTVVLTELVPHDEATRAHLQFRQSFTSLALHHGAVADGLRERYHDLHHRQLADLVRRDQAAGMIDAEQDPVAVSTRLAALAEGLAYYVLIGVTEPDAARAQLLDAVAALYRPR
ncbi:TetR/AcrR family transcriptional regulator [Pseudonocardia sediminis]|uniref:TetR/AcrR family transcriptional regulator n=1 Tax=Pseudonocardia sediminis TaxID=1397368 RepID=UPI001A9226F3|nr:TetR/AcrR family transcriptional regulator [Pseudonocardia sediminis]